MSSLLSVKLCVSSDEIATPRSSQFHGAPLREKRSSRQLHGLWFMCLIKTLLNARLDTWKDLKDLYFVAIVLLAGCAVFLSIPDEQLLMRGFLGDAWLFMGLINPTVHDIPWKADSYLSGQIFCGTRRLIALFTKVRHWIISEPVRLHTIAISWRHIMIRFIIHHLHLGFLNGILSRGTIRLLLCVL